MKQLEQLTFGLVPFVLIALHQLWVAFLNESGQLPSPLATHWGLTGQADGFSTTVEHQLTSSLIMGLFALGWLYVVISRRISPIVRKFLIVILACVQLTILGIFTLAIASQVGLEDATESRFGMELFLALLLPIAYLVLIFLTMPRIEISNDLVVRIRGISFLRLAISDIVSVRHSTASWRQFGGLGLRISGKKIAFLPSSGPVVEVGTSHGDFILIRSNNPDSVVELIRERMSK